MTGELNTKEEVIARFCKLATDTNLQLNQKEEGFGVSKPSDCFCLNSSISNGCYHFDLSIIEFIEQAVVEKINREQQ